MKEADYKQLVQRSTITKTPIRILRLNVEFVGLRRRLRTTLMSFVRMGVFVMSTLYKGGSTIEEGNAETATLVKLSERVLGLRNVGIKTQLPGDKKAISDEQRDDLLKNVFGIEKRILPGQAPQLIPKISSLANLVIHWSIFKVCVRSMFDFSSRDCASSKYCSVSLDVNTLESLRGLFSPDVSVFV